ncbi:MAG: sugar phosphate isomerase/epimerase [Bryobacteraceae bacterium]|nr:sugar phosphate isomerase/epimerase [Bryobacteraceae bacterium]
MSQLTRRSILSSAVPLAVAALSSSAPASAAAKKPFRLGILITPDQNPEREVKKVRDLGLTTCFVSTNRYDAQYGAQIKQLLERYQVEPTAVETLGPGEMVWDFMRGPATIGLVPRNTRQARIDALKRGSDLGKQIGAPFLQTHCGFIPEDPHDALYPELVAAVKEVALHCKGNGQTFLFETGQETPTTLMRAIEDVGLDNVGVGLDTANVILYGKANPVDAAEIFGKRIKAVHAKDGMWPTDPRKLGEEVAIGHGKVDFKRVFQVMHSNGYTGAITIEREISGPKQIEDVKRGIEHLNRAIATLGV